MTDRGRFSIHAIMTVKNEADIVASTLESAAGWADNIFVLDNGSEDGTAEIVRDAAARLSNVRFCGIDRTPFHDGLRARVFEQHRHRARVGDWWCRLDADEIALCDPRTVLDRVDRRHNSVQGLLFQFYLTRADADAYERDPEGWLALPLQSRIRHYASNWAEIRFVRHERGIRWRDTPWPIGLRRTFPERVPFRHYQVRSPEQLATRLTTRSGSPLWQHHNEHPEFYEPALPGAPAYVAALARADGLLVDGGTADLPPTPQVMPPLPPEPTLGRRALDRLLGVMPGGRIAEEALLGRRSSR